MHHALSTSRPTGRVAGPAARFAAVAGVAGLLTAGTAAGLTAVPGAHGATLHVTQGDILIASFGDLVTSAGVDKLDPKTLQVSDAASLGILNPTP
jgi:hypothetical protein